jgi:corrinoid protein of di/trimethylamine methyltransferase
MKNESKKEVLRGLADSIENGDVENAVKLAKEAINTGIKTSEIIEWLTNGMDKVSEKYEKGEYFLPNLLLAADAFYAVLDLIKPAAPPSEKAGKVVIGVVEGDIHDIGKNLVKLQLVTRGFDVIDLGKDVPLEKFVKVAKEEKADIVAMSTLMSTTMSGMEAVIERLKEEGIRDCVKVIVGGAPVSEEFARKIGADAYRSNATEGAEWCVEAVKTLPPSEERWSRSFIESSAVEYRREIARRPPEVEVDIGRVTAERIIEEVERGISPKKPETMSHMERVISAVGDMKVDRLPVYPVVSGALRKFLPCSYRDFCSDPDKYAKAVTLAAKYLDFDLVVGLWDLSVTAADLGAGLRFPEESTPFTEERLEDYEKIEVPEVKPGTRAYALIEASKKARERLKDDLIPFVGFHEGPLLTLTQLMGTERVLEDIRTNPRVVHRALERVTEYCCEVTRKFFEEDACDLLCVDYLWSNDVIIDAETYWEFEGKYVVNRHLSVFREFGQPLLIHNCSDVPHYDIQVGKFGALGFSYCYYPHKRERGSKNYADLIPEWADSCIFVGEIMPNKFLDNSEEGLARIERETRELMEGVLNALKESGHQSRYILATGCETPPNGPLDTVKKMIDVVKEVGPEMQKRIIG